MSPDTGECGPVEAATRAELAELGELNTSLGQVAVKLAVALDGRVTMATAAVAKELRATLDEIRTKESSHDDALGAFLTGLSAPVRN